MTPHSTPDLSEEPSSVLGDKFPRLNLPPKPVPVNSILKESLKTEDPPQSFSAEPSKITENNEKISPPPLQKSSSYPPLLTMTTDLTTPEETITCKHKTVSTRLALIAIIIALLVFGVQFLAHWFLLR